MKKEKNTDWIYYVFVFLSAIAVFTYILHVGFTMGVLFVNIASAPFIMQQHYGSYYSVQEDVSKSRYGRPDGTARYTGSTSTVRRS